MAYLDIVPEIPAWLLDDTEESVVGTAWHQEARSATRIMLQEEADRRGTTWGVYEEVELSGLPRPGGKTYNPRPDVMVLSHTFVGDQAAVALTVVGAPLFVAEIASPSTLRTDREGKRIAYALAGIPEYLLFDPSGTLLSSPVMAWRLPSSGARVYQPWAPEPDGSLYSQSLDVWFVPDPPYLRVRGNDRRLLEPPLDTARRARREAVARVDAEARALHAEEALRQERAQAEEALRQEHAQAEKALRQERAQAEADRAELARLRALLERQGE
jgi:Uma2 family endonuclease